MSRWPAPPPQTPDPAPRPTLFLDRDGVMVVEKDYLRDPDDVELEAGVAAALVRARQAGYRLVGVSNQSGLGRGRFSAPQFAAVMERFTALLVAAGSPLDAFYFCPHAPDAGCACRKPRPGLLDEAAVEFRWDPADSWVIGDKASDLGLARAGGMRGILVRTGHGRQEEARLGPHPDAPVVDDLAAAIALILESTP